MKVSGLLIWSFAIVGISHSACSLSRKIIQKSVQSARLNTRNFFSRTPSNEEILTRKYGPSNRNNYNDNGNAGAAGLSFIPALAGLTVGYFAFQEVISYEDNSVESHENDRLVAIKRGDIPSSSYNKILIDAIIRNDDMIINLIRKDQWEKIDLTTTTSQTWTDCEFISACYKNGYDDLADYVVSIRKLKKNGQKIPNFNLSDAENFRDAPQKLIERKEKYELWKKISDSRNYSFDREESLYPEILADAVLDDRKKFVKLIKKYLWHKINFNDEKLSGKRFLDACDQNGYGEIADAIKAVNNSK